jgi:hypothetical protein
MDIGGSAQLPPPEKLAPLRFDAFFDLPSGEMSRYVRALNAAHGGGK